MLRCHQSRHEKAITDVALCLDLVVQDSSTPPLLKKEYRKELRKALKKDIIDNNKSADGLPPNDEILMHHLFYVTGILKDHKELQLPHDRFCDLPEEAHKDATLLHFCNARKNNIPEVVRNLYGLEIL